MANITGDDNDNILDGTPDADVIMGLGGNDKINPGLGFGDNVDGGDGIDILTLDFSLNLGVNTTNINSVFGSGTIAATGRYITFKNIEQFNITGSQGADILYGFANNDIIRGGAGDDTITGGGGIDKLEGGAGFDILAALDLSSATTALSIKDDGSTSVSLPSGLSFKGFEQFGDLTTGKGNDKILFARALNNKISTGDGDDIINSGSGVDTVNGGGGKDLLVANFSINAGVISAGFNPISGAGTLSANGRSITFSGIEQFTITGSPSADVLMGFASNDSLNGGGGDDVITGGGGIDKLNGGSGVDTLIDANFSSATTGLTIKDDGSTVVKLTNKASASNFELFKTLTTGKGNDIVIFTTGYDNDIKAGDGDDTINPGLGSDKVDGGGGLDLLSADFSSNPGVAGTLFNPGLGSGTLTASGRSISFSGIEHFDITGSASADILTGFAGNDILKGGAGDDTITGGGGVDQLDGGLGTDTLTDADFSSATTNLTVRDFGAAVAFDLPTGAKIQGFERFVNVKTGSGKDVVNFKGDIDNVINTGAGDDKIIPGLGSDKIDGGSGTDMLTLSFAGSAAGVAYTSFNLSNGSGQFSAPSQNTSFSNIEQLKLTGSAYDDSLPGGVGSDMLNGGAGNDILTGNSGNDILIGSSGQDRLTGGSGKDTFGFGGAKQTTNAAPDLVTDFSHADGDKIDLAKVYSGKFSFIGTGAFSKVAGQLHYELSSAQDAALVSGDINGDGKGDFTIELTGVTSLVKGDFIL